jgi:hypothetical protein
MPPLKQKSPKKISGIVVISLLVWFVPFLPLPFLFGHELSGGGGSGCAAGLVLLPGAALCDLFLVALRRQGQIPELLAWCLGILTPASFAVLTLLASRWRTAIRIGGFVAASGLSWFAYMLMRA